MTSNHSSHQSKTNNKKEKLQTREAEDIMYDNYLFSSSTNDMTGLIPSVAHNEVEAQNYEEIFPYLPPNLPNPITGVPEPPLAECIHSEMRKGVTTQRKDTQK